jgi:hypothetical protein
MRLEQHQGDALALSVIRNALRARALVRQTEHQLSMMIARPVEDARRLLEQIEGTTV